MEPLRELRIPMRLEVRIWGMDSGGKPFSQMAHTVDISGRGARLAGIQSPKQRGDIIGVQRGEQKARFQVMWVGEVSTAAQGQIGIQCMDAGRCLWVEALKNGSDQFGQGPEILSPVTIAEKASAGGGEARVERRRYPRYPCAGGVKLRKDGTELGTWAKLADIGLGGCYAELMSPLPLQTPVEFEIQALDVEIHGRGIVRTMHPSVGNGVAFTQMGAEDWKRLNQLIGGLAQPATTTRTSPAAASTAEPDVAQLLQVLLELLDKKGVLSREEFLNELQRIKFRLAR
jgi:hypothetical protein